ncbi:hypothetical protein FB451DRAFT_1282771 [Mycena latifolia]|nr:hypothetical protein FB451DRAFT_1282771 [Mycena latifolia]
MQPGAYSITKESQHSTLSQTSLFSELAADILFAVFACCDISSVVGISQTCKYLHDLAFHKSVWLLLVGDLKRRAMIDSSLDLQALSTDELVNLVKGIITGPETWSPRAAGFAPEVAQEIVLHPKIATGAGILHGENQAQLVSSGRYVLFNNWTTLECWDVTQDRLVWKHTSTVDDARVVAFAAEEIEGGNALVIMICQRTYPRSDDRKNLVEIVELDVRQGTHDVLLFTGTPDTYYDDPFRDPVLLHGALAAVSITGRENTILLFDWKAQSVFALVGNEGYSALIALIPGHVILKAASSNGGEQIHLISNDALPTHPISTSGSVPLVPWDDIPKLSTLSDPDAWGWEPFQQMWVHASPIRNGEYRIWLYNSYYLVNTQPYGSFWSYRLSIAPGRPPQWHERPMAPSRGDAYYVAMTYSGHVLLFTNSRSLIIRIAAPESGEVDLAGHGQHVQVSPYSGAITYSTHNSIVIRYFK